MNKLLKLQSLKHFYLTSVWEAPLDQLSTSRNRLVSAIQITHLVIRDLAEGMITLRAMGLVYTTILALVPLLAVSFSVLKGFGVHNQIEPMLLNLFQPLGEKGAEVTRKIIEFVDNTKAGILGSLGLAILMYTVVSLIQKIEHAFNYTWRVTHHRPVSQRFSNYITVVLVGPILIFSAIGITASVSNLTILQDVMEVQSIGVMAKLLGHLIPYLLIISAFTFIYVFIPNTKVKIKSALMGAIVAGILWVTAGWGFATFVVSSSNYTAIYSAFATMIIFFIWLYINWLILLIGSSVAFYHQQPTHRHLGPRIVRLSNHQREIMALNIMMLIGRHYHWHKPTWSIESLARHMSASIDSCETLINQLVKAELLVEISGSPTTYQPAYDLETLSLNHIISSVRASKYNINYANDNVVIEEDIKRIHSEIEIAISQSLEGRTLKDLSVINVND